MLALVTLICQSANAGYFTNTGPMSTARGWHSATLLSNGTVLVTGGGVDDGNSSLSELFDPTNRTWTLTGSLQFGRSEHTATMLLDGKVLVAGGYGDNGNVDHAEIFDPSTGTWTNAGALTGTRSSHTATLLPGGGVLAAGGYGCCGFLSSTEIYNQSDGAWHTNAAMQAARCYHTATLLANGEVLVSGGNAGFPPYISAELFNPTNHTWRQAGSMITPRRNHTATLLHDGKVLVAGGLGLSIAGTLDSSELYDPETDSWTPTGSMASRRKDFAAILLSDGRVLVIGGYWQIAPNNIVHTGCEIYDPTTGAWTVTGYLNNARSGHTATCLLDGSIAVAGGSGWTGGTSEIFSDVPAFAITSYQRLLSGGFRFEFGGPRGASFSILGTTNLALPQTNWSELGYATEFTLGKFRFTDTQATNFPQRLYRARGN